MKKIMLIPVMALMMVSCQKEDQQVVAANDSASMTIEALKLQVEQQKIALAKQSTIDSMQMIADNRLPMEFAAAPAAAHRATPVRTHKRHRRAAAPESPVIQNTPVAQAPAPVDNSNIPATLPAEQKKKGWSNTAKGAVIGAGVGAIGGAIISKDHRVKGAVIGGLIGAAAGAGTGIILDKRKQRLQEWQ